MMPGPFPGMDPYLEGRNIWPDVHHRLITAIGDVLAPQVAPRYYVRIEQRTYIIEVDREEFVGRRCEQSEAISIIAASNFS